MPIKHLLTQYREASTVKINHQKNSPRLVGYTHYSSGVVSFSGLGAVCLAFGYVRCPYQTNYIEWFLKWLVGCLVQPEPTACLPTVQTVYLASCMVLSNAILPKSTRPLKNSPYRQYLDSSATKVSLYHKYSIKHYNQTIYVFYFSEFSVFIALK